MQLLSVCRANAIKCAQVIVDLGHVVKLFWSTGRNMYKARRLQRGSAAVAKRRLGG